MSDTRIVTYSDILDTLDDAMRMNSSGIGLKLASLKRCLLDAYDEFMALRQWNYLMQPYWLQLVAPQEAGTISFQRTGGSYDNQVTLSGAIWPSWAADGALYLDNMLCQVDEVKSDTVLTLCEDSRPSTDLTDQTYRLVHDWYVLPADFISMEQPVIPGSVCKPTFISQQEMLAELSRSYRTSSIITNYSIGQALNIYGRMAFQVCPFPIANTTIGILYRRAPRRLRHSGKDANDCIGTISAEAGSTTITGSATSGSATAFTSSMVGAILRANGASTTTAYPTGWDGSNPAAFESRIIAVNSASSLVVEEAPTASLSGVKYVITDPVDAPHGYALAITKIAERQLAYRIDSKNLRAISDAANRAISRAKAMDGGLTREILVAGGMPVATIRLADLDSNR